MKRIIVISLAILLSGCVVKSTSKANLAADSNSIVAIRTIILDDKKIHNEGGDAAIDWNKMTTSGSYVTDKEINDIISGKAMYNSGEKIPSLYPFYFLLKESSIDINCAINTDCVMSSMISAAKDILKNKNIDLNKRYKDDDIIFEFENYSIDEARANIAAMSEGLMISDNKRKEREASENAKLPETKVFSIDLSGDEYVNKTLNIINSERLEYNVSRDYNGNKINSYGTPSINSKKLYMTPKILKWKISNTLKVCADISVYANVNVTNACKDRVISGVRDWIEASRDKNISEMAWSIAAGEATAGNEILFSHWAGMARVHQKRMNERTDKSYYVY